MPRVVIAFHVDGQGHVSNVRVVEEIRYRVGTNGATPYRVEGQTTLADCLVNLISSLQLDLPTGAAPCEVTYPFQPDVAW